MITVVRNSEKTLADTVTSVLGQKYTDLEHIIVDGGSTDGTLEIIKKYEPEYHGRLRWVSEPDRGLYDAMNKGIRMASGRIIGIINGDDYYADADIITRVAEAFENPGIEAVIGNVQFVDPEDLSKVVRRYSSAHFKPYMFRYGFSPPHPTFFTWKRNYDEYGYYKADYRLAADYELLIRFLYIQKLKYMHLPINFVYMRTGGLSTRSIRSNYFNNKEIARACGENGIYTNMFILVMKYFIKVFELLPGR